MTLRRFHHGPFWLLLGLISMFVAGELAWCFRVIRTEQQVRRLVVAKLAEKEAQLRVRPASNARVAEALEGKITQLTAEFAERRLHIQGSASDQQSTLGSGEPIQSSDAFFAIARVVEGLRAQAAKSGVRCGPGEFFGFASYANAGPEPTLVGPVLEQLQNVESVLNILIGCEPEAIDRVERERPRAVVSKHSVSADRAVGQSATERLSDGASAAANADFFSIDERLTSRVPNLIDAVALRITFFAKTRTLRSLVNSLSVDGQPWILRSVEVVPDLELMRTRAGPITNSRSSTPEEIHPVIEDRAARFCVVVEHLDLVDRSAPPKEETL